jgi:hypothetical protein
MLASTAIDSTAIDSTAIDLGEAHLAEPGRQVQTETGLTPGRLRGTAR